MKDYGNIKKACRSYLFRDMDTRLSILLSGLLVLGLNFLLYKGAFSSRSRSYLLLMVYVLIVGLTQITANSMVMNLTVKDKLSKRMEFILASGMEVQSVIKAYTLEMWRISSLVPFILFFTSYLQEGLGGDFKWILGIYLSSQAMLYFGILLLNILGLSRKNFKFFKNLVFFGTTLAIYLVGNFSTPILSFLEAHHFKLTYVLLGINLFLGLVFGALSMVNLGRMTNESIINKEGTWS